jgi:hypothetical protein
LFWTSRPEFSGFKKAKRREKIAHSCRYTICRGRARHARLVGGERSAPGRGARRTRGAQSAPKSTEVTLAKYRRKNKMQSRPAAHSWPSACSSALSKSEVDPSKGARARRGAARGAPFPVMCRFSGRPRRRRRRSHSRQDCKPVSVDRYKHISSPGQQHGTQELMIHVSNLATDQFSVYVVARLRYLHPSAHIVTITIY